MRVVDPDVWRTVGWEDDPNHFIDFGVPEYGDFPFAALPRDYTARAGEIRTGDPDAKRPAAVARSRRCSATCAVRSRSSHARRRMRRPTWCCSPLSRRTTSRTRISRSMRPTTTTAQLTGNRGIHAALRTRPHRTVSNRLRLTPAPPVADVEPARYVVRPSCSSVPAGRSDSGRGQGGARRQGHLRRRVLRGVLQGLQPLLERQLSKAISATAGTDHRRVGAGRAAHRDRYRPQAAGAGASVACTVHLIPVGRGRFELYAEPPDGDDHEAPGEHGGRVRRWIHQAQHQWRRLVDAARHGRVDIVVRAAGATRSSAAWPTRSPSSARSGRCDR